MMTVIPMSLPFDTETLSNSSIGCECSRENSMSFIARSDFEILYSNRIGLSRLFTKRLAYAYRRASNGEAVAAEVEGGDEAQAYLRRGEKNFVRVAKLRQFVSAFDQRD